MSTLILRPNTDSTPLEQNATTPHYAKIDEETLSEADYVLAGNLDQATSKTDIYGFPDHTTESGTINSVTYKAKAKYALNGTCAYNSTINPSVKIGSTVYSSGAQNLTTSTAEYSYAWTTNPATSSAWSWTEIDDLLAGDVLHDGFVDFKNNRTSYKYQLWVEVDYTAGGGSTVFLPNIMKHNFIPPMIGGY